MEERGRFEPATVKMRLGEHMINVPMPHVDNTRAGAPENQQIAENRGRQERKSTHKEKEDVMADIIPTNSSVSTPKLKIIDYSNIPHRPHVYAASDRSKKIVHKSLTMDTLFSGVWPSQWSSPEAPEFHEEMDRCKEAGFKVLAACPSADSMDVSIKGVAQALMFYLNKINVRPDKYKIVRATDDTDAAIKENKLGLFFTHQGTALFNGDVDMVGLWRQLGYGYCLLAYNQRNTVGDGCFEKSNAGLTANGKQLRKVSRWQSDTPVRASLEIVWKGDTLRHGGDQNNAL